MIHLCTCTGGSTSNNKTTSSKRSSRPLSCKNCGGRSSINGKSSSTCLLTTVLELTSLINSDFTWTKVSKGCRSSSRRPRSSNTISLTNNSKVLEMPVSESEKSQLGVSVLGCHFSEKAEHIPIKKRRFLFNASSPPRQTSPRAFNHEIKANPSLAFVPESVTGMCERSGNDDKLVKKELVKKAKNEPGEDDDFSGISILAAAACSNSFGAEADHCEGSGIGIGIGITPSVTKTPESKDNISKSANICNQESGSYTLTNDHSAQDKFTLDKSSSKLSPESAIPPAKDVKFNWDLNMAMDAWEEPFGEEKKEDCTKYNSGVSEPGSEKESVIPSKDASNLSLSVEKSLAHEVEFKLGKSKPELMSCESHNAQHSVTMESAIPVTMESPIPVTTESVPGIFSKWTTRDAQISSGTEAVDTKLSMDCSLPPGFDQCLNLQASKENTVAESAIPEFEKHDLSLTFMENGVVSHKVNEPVVKMEVATSDDVSKETKIPLPPPPIPCMRDSGVPLENGIGFDNSQSRGGNGNGSGYDSQYEDGELRESSMNAWKGEMEKKDDLNNVGITDSHEPNTSPCVPQEDSISPGVKLADPEKIYNTVVSPEKIYNTDEVLSGSELNEAINNQANIEREEIVNQSDEWKMNVSGLDHLPENQRVSSSNFTKTRTFTSRKFSYGEQKDPEDADMKGEGSRFYRKETITRIGGPSNRDVFLSRGRFHVQGCSSKSGDGLNPRQERESGVVRSFGRGRYDRRGTAVWNRSPERAPPFIRSMLDDAGPTDNMTSEGSMDLNDSNRQNTSSYITRRTFRSRSPMNREANDFRARLGLRPTGETGHERFSMTRGRGRGRVGQVRYNTRVDPDGPRRFHGPESDECDEFVTEYFPRRRRCFSPVERRGNANNRYSDSISPSRPRTRSRSPSFRIRRARSPNYRAFEPEYARNGNSSPPPNSRWVRGPAVFDRRSSPSPQRERERERFNFYERKPKQNQNEFYRSGRFDPGEGGRGRPRFVGNEADTRPDNNGYRRGGFVRRYNMDGNNNGKRFHYNDEDGFGRGFDARDKIALEAHARGNLKSGGTDGRFKDFPRRSREDDFKRRSREGKDAVDTKEEKDIVKEKEKEKDQSNLVDSMLPNEVAVNLKEGDSNAN